MAQLSQTQKIISILQEMPKKQMTAREIAYLLWTRFPEDYALKRNNPRFDSDEDLIAQIAAEIGAQKQSLANASSFIHWQDKPRPRLYWFDAQVTRENSSKQIDVTSFVESEPSLVQVPSDNEIRHLSEADLYPLLMDYLSSELNLKCLRIDEKTSSNNRGANGNQWLHPDIVALQALDENWDNLIKTCVKHGSGQNVRLWSFEVKKELNRSNVRSSFFQAVSNCSWANEGYLVCTSLSNDDTEEELRMLSSLHGIGLILLNTQNPTESEMLLPARRRTEVDWLSINRILKENKDFKNFIDLVAAYYQTGRIRRTDWFK